MTPIAKTFMASIVVSIGLATTASAQNAQWNALFDRIIRLEAQVKAMNRTGGGGGQFAPTNNQQNRLLLNEMRQLRQMLRSMDNRLRALERRVNRSGRFNQPAQPRRRTAQLPPPNPTLDPNGIENYQYDPDNSRIFVEIDPQRPATPQTAPRPVPPPRAPAGNWQTKRPAAPPTAVPPVQPQGQTAALQPPTNPPGGVERRTLDGNQVEQTDFAKTLFDRASSDLRSRRFGAAESGFKSFLTRHQSHKLAPSAQFMLGETYYVQKNWRLAAQTYLKGYRRYPKSNRASDNLLKLGMSLARLGQKPQSCGAFQAVVSKKSAPASTIARARKEMKRVGC